MTTESSTTGAPAPPLIIRYVDAVDFGQHPVEWVLLIQEAGQVILTVEGLPIARVEPVRSANVPVQAEAA